MKWVKGTCKIKSNFGEEKQVDCIYPWKDGYVWAIHRCTWFSGSLKRWNITWIPSGAKLASFKSIKKAKGFFEEFHNEVVRLKGKYEAIK